MNFSRTRANARASGRRRLFPALIALMALVFLCQVFVLAEESPAAGAAPSL